MARYAEQQSRIDQRRKEIAARYPRMFSDMIAEWKSPGSDDRAWLLYSANYLFRTGGVRWAMDPLTMCWRVPGTPAVDLSHAFDQLDFVLLTHSHADHLDFDLLRAIRHLPIRWVIPDYILPQVLLKAALQVDRIIIPHPHIPMDINGINILPFAGQHWEASRTGSGYQHGVPATGYLVEFNRKRWLFPGDTRDYLHGFLHSVGPVDGLIAHLWLGRSCALMDEPPLLDEFCRFCFELQPKRVVLAHLEEFGRGADDYWEDRHVRQVISRWEQVAPQISISAARMGGSVIL